MIEPTAEVLIEARAVRKRYPNGVEALRGVSLTVRRGEVVCIIGPSGSGKSTLLRTFNALESIDEGQVQVLGQPVHGRRTDLNRLRARVGMVFQAFNLFPHCTVLENLMLAPVRVAGLGALEARTRAEALLVKVGLADKALSHPAQLSGGQQQRVAIARALAMNPDILLFDEPTSALDPELEQEVVRVIKALAEEGRTMLIVTHDMKLAADVSDHTIFLHKGLIEEQGPPETLFGAPKSERLRQFLSATMAH